MQNRNHEVRALDIDIGENDNPGLSLELTADDIDDIAFDPDVSVEERRGQLIRLREETSDRASGDEGELLDADLRGDDMHGLRNHISMRLASLDNPTEGDAELSATGMDTDDRSDDDDPADHVDDDDDGARIEDLSRRSI